MNDIESISRPVSIRTGEVELAGDLSIPEHARGLVLFAHGSGSSRKSTRNRYVAAELGRAGLGTLLLDLLTVDEERIDMATAALRFDIPMLADRLAGATGWAGKEEATASLRIGYFGASTGAAAALVAAARLGPAIAAVVSRGGRPDLAGPALPRVTAPTLLIVGGDDDIVIELNNEAYSQLACVKEMTIIPGASHLFEEAGALEEVARHAAAWFGRHLRTPGPVAV
jgi:pimeloyl-ACP methyl ester carboxylesterase